MKKLVLAAMSLLFAITAEAQREVTRFLGIPVDGSKYEMIQKLKEKGFRSTSYDRDVLEGEFNGTDVYIKVATNNNKVWRICLADVKSCDETSIRIRFNTLCQQFKNNSKYNSESADAIPDDEDISYEMLVNKKRYQASFFQKTADEDQERKECEKLLLSKYTEEQLANPTEEQLSDIMMLSCQYILEQRMKRSVWFMISESLGKYYITMYYDNEYNHANGEDL